MNKPSRIKNNNRRDPLLTGMPSWLTSLLPILLLGLTLTACDSVPTEETVNTSSGNTITGYTGDACGTGATNPDTIADICNFKIEFWEKMPNVSQCEECHDSTNDNQTSVNFLDSADVNRAYRHVLSLVNKTDIASSDIITKINNNHKNSCGNATACAALATIAEEYLNNWINGGATVGVGTSNDIVLEVPTIKAAGESKTLPPAPTPASVPAGFTDHVWPLLVDYCSNCHRERAPVPQAPFFAEGNKALPLVEDIAASYAAILASQKINLDIPRNSRLVARMDEGHNCWDQAITEPQAMAEGRKNCAVLMEKAISDFAALVPLDTVDSRWVVSKAMNIVNDGQVASGGARDDSSTIALYKFQSGAGSKSILDVSGVGTELNLDLYGTEDVDYKWVGGWGIEFVTPNGKAQGTTQLSTKLRDYITASGEYSIEAWVIPGNVTQGDANDPARIISYSAGTNERNFTLGQAEYRYALMNRTTSTDDNGEPTLLTDDDDEDLQATQQHVVVTFSPATGRKIYVNGVDVSLDDNAGAGSSDPVMPAGSTSNWDDTFAFILGNEASNNRAWTGKLRLVAIHNRAMSQTQIMQNFDAGVGEKFYVLFSVSEQMETNNPSCIVAGVHQCFVYFEVSQFDSYSYLFDKPTFVSLNPDFTPNGTVVEGLRIGLNGKEPAVGQAFANLATTIGATGYDSTTRKQVLSPLGTIIALEKGADNDEFFLSFKQLDTTDDSNTHAALKCGDTGFTFNCNPAVPSGDPVSDIGLRTFDETNRSMEAMTGISMESYSDVKTTFLRIKQQLPTIEDIGTFLTAHEIAVAQLAVEYCNALVNDTSKRDAFFPGFNFSSPASTAFDSATKKGQISGPLADNFLGINLATQPALTGADNVDGYSTAVKPEIDKLIDTLIASCSGTTPCDTTRTATIVKASCASVLGSAVTLIQ